MAASAADAGQANSQTTSKYRIESPHARPGDTFPIPGTTQDHKRDHPPGGNQGRCTDHPRANPPRTHPAGLRSKHGTASTFEHTPSTGDEFGSANMGATSGHCTPYEDPVASIQAQRKPRAVSNGWGNGPPANDAPNNNAESNHPMILKSRRRHHHRKRTTTNVNVGFLNLHGARKAAKWAELYKTLNSEKIALYGVVETHLRELEEPPVDPEWQWVGCNRTGDCRKGGGAGVLWRSNTAWMPMKGPCAEHIWVSGTILGCMSPPPRRGMYLPSKSVERVAKDFESSPQRRESRSYSEFMRALDAVMRTQMVQERPGRRPQNPWWDKEVEVAWKERRQANREHRRFVKGLDTEVCAEKWAVYLDRKHKVQTLIQCKIADYNLRLIQSIRQEGRSAAHKFWTYIRIERALLNSNLGFSMRFSTTSAEENFHLPGLAFADDLVVMAESNQELQSLLDICQTELASLGLRFNTKKSAVVRLTGGSTDAAALTLGGELLATRNDYRYLGVTLWCTGCPATKHGAAKVRVPQQLQGGSRPDKRNALWLENALYRAERRQREYVHEPLGDEQDSGYELGDSESEECGLPPTKLRQRRLQLIAEASSAAKKRAEEDGPSRPSAKIPRRRVAGRQKEVDAAFNPRHMATQTAWPAKKDVAVQTVLADIVKMPRIAQDHKRRTRSRYRGSPRKELEPCQRCFALWGAPFENYGWADEVETIGTKQTFNVAASTNELHPYNILARHCRYIPRLSLPREHGNSRRPHLPPMQRKTHRLGRPHSAPPKDRRIWISEYREQYR
ncbi:hypothetical protein MRX96_031891 [Rhipicephalus microplus]